MGLTLITAPTVEPLSLDEAKAHVRADGADDDALISQLLMAARLHLEGKDGRLNRAFVTQTWELTLDTFPCYTDGPIEIPLAPLQSVTSITYIDTAGATQTWAPANYIVDAKSEPGRVTPAFGQFYPPTRRIMNAVTIRFVAGHGAPSAVPEDLKLDMKMIVALFYENREPVQAGAVSMAKIPMHLEERLASHRVYTKDSF